MAVTRLGLLASFIAAACASPAARAPASASAEPFASAPGAETPSPEDSAKDGAQPPPAAASDPNPSSPTLVDLTVAGHRPALLSVPPGDARRPVFVAAHGAGGSAEELCGFWQPRVGKHAYVLCTRGVPMNRSPNPGWFYPDHYKLGKELMASLKALADAHPRADQKDLVYMGYSQGATMGALFIQNDPERFPRLLLVEGGFADWDVRAAKRYAGRPGAGVVILCGVAHCAAGGDRSRGILARAGAEVRFEHVRGGGHTYAGSVGVRALVHLRWLVRDDPRWSEWRSS